MYTNNYNDDYNDEEEYELTSKGGILSDRGILIKILIIIVCIAILIWLVIALKRNNSKEVVYDPTIHNTNVEKIRLASEKYFFIDGNMPKENSSRDVSLFTLINNGYIKDITDANNKVCNDVNSNVTLTDSASSYVMTIKLSCSTNDKVETFDYSKLNYACLNCNGMTYMDGKTQNNVDNKDDENKDTEKKNNDQKDNNNSKQEEHDDIYDNYNCKNWSNWSTVKVNNSLLEERTRTLVKGVKYTEKVTSLSYGPWTDYVETPILPQDNLEIQTINQTKQVWSENKTSNEKIVESDKVKLISKEKVKSGTSSYCPKGYTKQDGKCVGEKQKGDLTYLQYNSGDYLVYNRPCEAVNVEKDSTGKYTYMYKSCQYSKVTEMKKGSSTKSIYTYQELEEQPVTLYRARVVYQNTTNVAESYTDNYYEESKLPSGYVKLPGSEKVEYSYKIAVCEK